LRDSLRLASALSTLNVAVSLESLKRLHAEIALAAQPSDVAAAEERYREAKALAGALEMRPLLAHCHLGLGKLYRRTGKHEQAREHLAIATTMFREMEMQFWPEQAEAEIAALRR